MTDDLFGRLRARLARATPGPWEIQDGCSWRRIGAGGRDGNVLCPSTYSRTDRHPDLSAGKGEDLYANLELIVDVVNALPTLLDALEALRPTVPEGYVMVPRGPFETFRRLASHSLGCSIYQRTWVAGEPPCSCGLDAANIAMLAASPTIPDDIKSGGVEIPAGMVPWNGGDSAPEDWDDTASPSVGYRCGGLGHPAPRPQRWQHQSADHDESFDIIAYTPKRSPSPASDASEGVDLALRYSGPLVPALRKAAMDVCGSPLEEAVPVALLLSNAADALEKVADRAIDELIVTPSLAGEEALRALRWLAAEKTVDEILQGEVTMPEWDAASLERRIEMMGERKRAHDAAVLDARAALSSHVGER